MPITASINIMKCCLFLKILCKNANITYIRIFKEEFEKAEIFNNVVDLFEAFHLSSRLLSIRILNFFAFMLFDFNGLYFQFLSGVRLDKLIGYINHSSDSKKDTEIVSCHSKFLNACLYCLYSNKCEGKDKQLQEKIEKSDLERLGKNLCDVIQHLIGADINAMYK